MKLEEAALAILAEDFSHLDETDLTAEKYGRMGSVEKFQYRMKWTKEDYEAELSGTVKSTILRDKLAKYDKPLKRTVIKCYLTKRNIYHESFESVSAIVNSGLKVTEEEVRQSLRSKDKYERIRGLFRFEKVSEILVGNDYEIEA